jgi:hypothetical protein
MKDLRCLLGLHRWRDGLDEDGEHCFICIRCKKDSSETERIQRLPNPGLGSGPGAQARRTAGAVPRMGRAGGGPCLLELHSMSGRASVRVLWTDTHPWPSLPDRYR